MTYTPLYVKSDYSLLSSLITIDELIKKCLEYNITSIAITEENNNCSTIEFYKKCIKNNIKPIIGLELKFLEFKILLYAKNYEGYQNLIKLSTLKSEREIVLDDLKKLNSNVICIVPYIYINIFNELDKIYTDIFIGYNTNKQKEEILKITNNIVFINETLYLEESNKIYLKYANLIRDGKKNNSLNDYHYENNHFLNPKTICNDDIKTTNIINEMCDFKFKKQNDLMPQYITENNIPVNEYLIELSKKGLGKRLNNKIPKIYADRLLFELDVITNKNFANYFLIVANYVKYAKKNNILVGPGRGSAASSLVSYCLGITDIDPIKYNLLFERFLNPERLLMPDIDIDFEDDKRNDVINYIVNKYGTKNVAGIVTYSTLTSKAVIRDVSKLFDIPVKIIDRINFYIPSISENNLIDIYNSNNKLKELIDSSDDISQMFKIATILENKKRHHSVHAAGIILATLSLDNIIPLIKTEEMYITGYSMEYLEELGLLKMDLLSLSNLTTIKNIVNDIEINENIKLNLNDIDDNDEDSLKLFAEANTIGIFQFETQGMKNLLKKINIKNFEELIAALALFRPGPMDNINLYIKNKNSKEKINYIHEDLKEILMPTYGVIIYQEQIMRIANIMASFSLGEADVLRRAISKKKKDIMLNEKEKFINRSIKSGYDKQTAEDVFNLILKFAGYGFNRAHSVSYAKISFQMAYLKTHYYEYFIINLLNNAIGSEIKLKEYISEIKQNKINLENPNINISETKFIFKNNKIYYSLSAIKGIGNLITNEIIEERNKKPFTDIFDFIIRCYSKNVNKKVIETLIDANAFSDFNMNHKTMYQNLDIILNYADLVKDLKDTKIEKPVIIALEEYSHKELMEKENNVLGMYLNGSPVEQYRNNDINTNNFINYFDKVINIYLLIDKIKIIKTKKNDEMCFISGSDEYNNIDLTLFPDTYKKYNNLKVKNIIKVTGRVEKRMAKYQIIVNTIDILE